MSYVGSSFISQPVQDELDGKVSLVSATTQSIGSALDVSGNINLTAGSEFQINGVPIGGGGSNLPTIDTLVITETTDLYLSQTDITYITGYTLTGFITLLLLDVENVPAGKTKTIIAQELNGKMVRIGIPSGTETIISPLLTKNGQQQTFLWSGTKWTYDDNKITANLLGWGAERGVINNNNLTIQSELQESGDINLLTGKKYKINSVNLEAVAETLSNKTISGTSNTILNLPISSTTGLQTALDGKVALVSATKQTIGSALDVSGNINLTAGSEFLIDGVPIGGGGGGTPGGVEGSVQYNASGAFAGESDFNYSASTNTLTLTNGTLRPDAINFNSEKIAITGNSTIEEQGLYSVAIGNEAGKVSQQFFSVAVGYGAGKTIQGNNSVAIGRDAGSGFQGNDCVAIGISSGGGYQAEACVAIGDGAGGGNQSRESVAIGRSSGGVNQGMVSVAIGFKAGQDYQSSYSTAIGCQAGSEYQGNSCVAIGYQAGYVRQGQHSIAIGREAGTYEQPTRTIMINATGGSLDSTTTDALFIKPIRNETNLSGFLQLYYNPSTGEIVYN